MFPFHCPRREDQQQHLHYITNTTKTRAAALVFSEKKAAAKIIAAFKNYIAARQNRRPKWRLKEKRLGKDLWKLSYPK